MSEQGVKVHLACDGLNRTGQEAPASQDRNRDIGNILPLDPGRIRRYTLGREKNRRGRQKWEGGKRRRDDSGLNAALRREAFELLAALSPEELTIFTRSVIDAQLRGALPPFGVDPGQDLKSSGLT